MPLYREDFDHSACDCPSCDETRHASDLYLHPRCHPQSPTWVRYRGDVLTVECAKCRREVVAVVIASRAHDLPDLRSGARPEPGPGPEPEPEDDDERCP